MSEFMLVGIAIGIPIGIVLDRVLLPEAVRALIRHGWR